MKHLLRKPRHRWFSSPERYAEDGWYGPHETVEAAIVECACPHGDEPVYVAQGYRLNKREREEWGVDFEWQVNSPDAFEVRLPRRQNETT